MASPRLEQQKIDDQNWYYEHTKHILLVHEVKMADGTHFRTDMVEIPWRKIEASLARRKLKAKKR